MLVSARGIAAAAAMASFFPISTVGSASGEPPAPTWTSVAIRPENQPQPGGEGGQWPRGPVAISASDPNFMLLPIDVGGVYRSIDGGKQWRPAMIGWAARGANGFAIDPTNADRVVGIAANSSDWNAAWGASPNGLYRSVDRAASWSQILPRLDGVAGAVAWDPSSFDPAFHGCRRAFYLNKSGEIFRSDDGAATWARVNDHVAKTPELDWSLGGTSLSMLSIEEHGRLWVAGSEGVFESDDAGMHFRRVRDQETLGLSIVGKQVAVCGRDGVLLSSDGGNTFHAARMAGLDRGETADAAVRGIAVSPADPKQMLCWVVRGPFDWPRFVSSDRGASWQPVLLSTNIATFPTNARQGHFAWDPNRPERAWSLGGDWVACSTDRGHSFRWANNGNAGAMVGGMFSFNSHRPAVLFLGFQDYNGAFTIDGGKTWKYCDVSGKGWGGHAYGAVALDEKTMWAGEADGWDAPRRLRVTHDAGTSWTYVKGSDGQPLDIGKADVSLIHPLDPKVGFAGACRTQDGGSTWTVMARDGQSDGCDGVFASEPSSGVLWGRSGDQLLVRSSDLGRSWRVQCRVEGGFRDIAVDEKRQRVYLASNDVLKAFTPASGVVASTMQTIATPVDTRGGTHVWTVATDPVDPAIIYVGGPSNIFATDATICRSVDAGKTWQNLTKITPLVGNDADSGPREVSVIRVNPATRDAWAAGQCFGVWKIRPPER